MPCISCSRSLEWPTADASLDVNSVTRVLLESSSSWAEFGLSCDRFGVKFGLSCDRSGVEFGLSCDRSGVQVRVKL